MALIPVTVRSLPSKRLDPFPRPSFPSARVAADRVRWHAATGNDGLGEADAGSPLDERPFPTRPLYTDNPWFLPAMMSYYNRRDQIELRRA